MSQSRIQSVLERLQNGDKQAISNAIRAYQPLLQSVVRKHMTPELRARFDSTDIVQSAWLRVLEKAHANNWIFGDDAKFRAFLVKVARHRLIDRVRQEKARTQREQATQECRQMSGQVRPSQYMLANELWKEILSLCPKRHRPILELRLQGLTYDEIAERVSMHPSSVRRFLAELLKQIQSCGEKTTTC